MLADPGVFVSFAEGFLASVVALVSSQPCENSLEKSGRSAGAIP
jgi:hypothetical protein